MNVTIGGPLQGSPFTLSLAGGETHAGSSVLRRPDGASRELTPTVAGRRNVYYVEARDAYGNPRAKGGDVFVASLTGAADVPAAVTDEGEGIYAVAFRPTRAGAYTLSVSLGGEQIAGSRFALSVSADKTSAAACVAAGVGLRDGVAGETARFSVQAWDAYGNVSAPPPNAFRVSVVSRDSPLAVAVAATAAAGGRFRYAYSPTVAGEYDVSIVMARPTTPARCSSMGATASTFEAHRSGCASGRGRHAPACAVQWASPDVVVAGRPTKLRVTARDKFYNDRESGGDKFELALRPAGDRAGEAATRGDVHDMKDGTYEASVVGTTAGEYRLVVLLPVKPPPVVQVVVDDEAAAPAAERRRRRRCRWVQLRWGRWRGSSRRRRGSQSCKRVAVSAPGSAPSRWLRMLQSRCGLTH